MDLQFEYRQYYASGAAYAARLPLSLEHHSGADQRVRA